MPSENVVVSDEQLAKLIDAYKTIQEFLGSVLERKRPRLPFS
jgi:hypothetical protein